MRQGEHGAGTYALAMIAGALLWLVTSVVSGQGEAWDSSLYWTVAYPLAILFSGLLGYLAPRRPWRWALAVMLVQPVVMVLTSPASPSMLPLGLVLFLILSLPAMAAALLGAFVRARMAGAPR